MSNRQITTRAVHPDSIAELGFEECVVALGVAADLRSGKIPPEHYDQGQLYTLDPCGTPCCIAGHVALRLGHCNASRVFTKSFDLGWGDGLFAGGHPSDPQLAADAIERYVYDGNKNPWRA